MNEPELPTSIQITRTNLTLLEQVGVAMQKQFPHLWGDQKPTPSSIVGFLANEFLADGANSPRALTRGGETPSAAGGSVSRDGDYPAASISEQRQVYALRGQDGKLRGTWHSPSYEECPGTRSGPGAASKRRLLTRRI